MAAGAAIALAADLLEDLDLLAPAGLHQRGGDAGAVHQRGADLHVGAFAEREHLVEGDLGADVARQLLHHQHVAWLDPVLFSAGFDHRVHRHKSLKSGLVGIRRPSQGGRPTQKCLRPREGPRATAVTYTKGRGEVNEPAADPRPWSLRRRSEVPDAPPNVRDTSF